MAICMQQALYNYRALVISENMWICQLSVGLFTQSNVMQSAYKNISLKCERYLSKINFIH